MMLGTLFQMNRQRLGDMWNTASNFLSDIKNSSTFKKLKKFIPLVPLAGGAATMLGSTLLYNQQRNYPQQPFSYQQPYQQSEMMNEII